MWEQEGFLKGSADVDAAMQKLALYIDAVTETYLQFTAEELLKRPAPGKWSKQEILGHLTDSALNNVKRFTEIQFSPQPYTVVPYKQEELVMLNHYQHLPLEHLLVLWQSLNRQIIYIVKNIPPERLNYKVNPHYDNNEMKTLGWIIADYVAHMEHHLEQVKGIMRKNNSAGL